MKVMVMKINSIKVYFDEIKPYLKDINNLKTSDTWKTNNSN